MEKLISPFEQAGACRLMIFGHPGHELALFGALQRHPPARILIITDGGGEERVEYAKNGLAKIGLLERVYFLNYSEASFYEAMLDHDAQLFNEVARAIQIHINQVQPDQIFCDAVEFYNPVHDITLPLVRSALGNGKAALYEVPLVYQASGAEEAYIIQRIPTSLADRRVQFELSEAELAAKISARNDIYKNLREQAGPEFMELTAEHASREEFAVSCSELAVPDTHGRMLRYERRARLLHTDGAIKRMITYRDHYLPAAADLLQPAHYFPSSPSP
jgi:hypothetical protein